MRRRKRLRILAVALSFCMLAVTYPNILETLSVLAAEIKGEGDGSYVITSFAPLDEEIREQTVLVGTDLDSLYLPDTLEAAARPEDEKILGGGLKSPEDSEQEDEKEKPDDSTSEEDTDVEENPDGGEDAGEEKNPDGEEDAGANDNSGSEEDAGGEENPDGEENADGNGGSDGGEDIGGNDDSDDGEKAGGNDNSDGGENADEEEKADDSTDDGDSGADQSEGTGDGARAGSAMQESFALTVQTGLFVLPVYASQNIQDNLHVETFYESDESQEASTSTETENGEAADEEAVTIEDITWESSPSYDGETAGEYVFTPVLPEGYLLAEDVTLPQITVTVEAGVEYQAVTAAGELLQKLLEKYFGGLSEDEIYEAILAMDEDTRLDLTADYEEMLAAMTGEDEADGRLQRIVSEIERGIADAAAKMPVKAPVFLKARAAAPRAAGSIPLRRISGSGNAFVYHSFRETKSFTAGETYAFLNGVYGYEDAVSALGSGAILKATDEKNSSILYIRIRYGLSVSVRAYVDVVTKGNDFDYCVRGGLYQVPDSGTPTEYRYFCDAGGAQNCGPYYAYSYVKESLTAADVTASLNDIEKQGSTDSKDYTVTVTFGGNRSMTLDAGSYTIQIPDPASDEVNIIISDSEGNKINTKFRMPLAVRYDGNGTGVSNVPAIQPAWKGESVTISAVAPARSGGYSFNNWKEAQTGTTYTKGQRISSFGSASLLLKAQWKDTLAPTVGYTPTQVMTRATEAEVKAAVEAALTITDNEPVEECKIEITVPPNFTATAGNKNVTVKVTDKAGNATTKTCTVSVMSYVDFSMPVFKADTKNLSVVLRNPGTDTITESGFVWGIMNAPSVTINNGKKATASPVAKVDGTISVTADNLQKGVTYYARAYVVAGGAVYYSDEISIGLGLPAYGTFTIKNNNNNTFTVTRSGGSEGVQTVYYRTVNGSAVGGTHFTHQASTLTFAAGETSKTITITEKGANTAYSGKPATAYTNADRTYSVEIYRVTGGGTLGSPTRAGRTMTKNSGYTVDRSVYTKNNEDKIRTSSISVYDPKNNDADGGKNRDYTNLWQGRGHDNPNYTRTIPHGTGTQATYIDNTATGWGYRLVLDAKYENGGDADVWLGFAAPPTGGIYVGVAKALNIANQKWAGSKNDINGTYKVPGGNFRATQWGDGSSSVVGPDGESYVLFSLEQQTAHIHFGAHGADADVWNLNKLTGYSCIVDTKEPQFLAVAPMAGGLYKVGDPFTVSLIFDEIVDSQNSGDLGGITVNTTWGQAEYVGGANTNVLYFSGTIVGNAEQTLKVNSFTNADRIKDMCNSTTTQAASSGSGTTNASVDTAKPNIAAASQGIAGGTGTVNVTVNADQSKTNSLRYAWSDSASLPATGWVDASAAELSSAKGAGLSLSIRKEPGSGAGNGKWYLHVIGTYSTTGATDYKYACVDFGTVSAPAAGSEKPSLSVSTNNSAWATQRAITIQTKGGGTLQYRKSGASAWTNLAVSAGSVTVTENGYYTFRLTAADNVLTQNIQVEKIDRINPTASIGGLLESGSTQSPKAGIYTKITLPVTFADSGSGVKTVQYAWTNTQTTPSSGWQTLSASQVQAGKAELSYTATESAETTKYLHIKVTDNLNHTYTTKTSSAYKVISQSAVTNHTPKITLTGAPTKWTNDMVTLEWKLTNYAGKNYEVILPDGRKARSNAVNGETWAIRNGTYTVKVRDLDYGGENTATVNVQYIDTTAPAVSVSGVPSDWQGSGQTVTFSAGDSQSGVGKKYIKIMTSDEEIPTEGLTELTSNTVRVNGNGIWYVYYKYYDRTGDDSAGREANKTEGFAGPIKIDGTAPALTASYGTVGVSKSEGLPVSVKATYGMSGGNVKVNDKEIAALTAEPENTDGEINKETDYQVTEKGTYRFVLTGGSGKTVTKSMTVYEAAFASGTDTEVSAQLVAANGTLVKPDDPERTGYVFKGWYTAESGGNKWDFDANQVKANQTLYARWNDETRPEAPVLQEGVVLPTGWTNTQKTIPLTLYDSVGVTQLWVSVDDGAYRQVNGFTGSAGDVPYNYEYTEVAEGEHTYRFKAKDAAGNESDESEKFTVTLDSIKPVIGPLTYENQAANLWQYIIGKTSLIIHVPVTETGSGVKKISYTMTPEGADGNPDSGKTQTKTEDVRDGESKIAFSEDFRGTITITCTDKAGNDADSVTVGIAGNGGVIVEDHAPDIATDLREDSYYDNAPEIGVTVKDDTAQTVTAGIAAATYQVGGSAEKAVSIDTSSLKAAISFTIPASEIPAGITTIRITAKDHAGNEASRNVTVRIKGQEAAPAASINYLTEKLKDLVPNVEYQINGVSYRADGEGCVPIPEKWIGTTVSIVKKGNGRETTDSEAQKLSIPARPQKPAPTGVDVAAPGGTGKLTGLTAGTAYEISTDDGRTWEAGTAAGIGEITGLAPGSYVVRVKAGISNFTGKNSDAAKIGAYQVKVIFMANGEKYREIFVDYGTALTQIPTTPPKKDAGNQIFVGEWCMDEQGTTPADFTSIIAETTVYAVYSTGHTVTLRSGAGYTLAAQPGSISPVKEGGSFSFSVTINSGYEKTGSFAVSVNGETIMPAADGIYTIEDIMENKVVTADGVRKKPSSDNDKKTGNNTQIENGGSLADSTEAESSVNPGHDPKPVDGTALDKEARPDGEKQPADKTDGKENKMPDSGVKGKDRNKDTDAENSKKPGENQNPEGQSDAEEQYTVLNNKIVSEAAAEPVFVGKTEKTAAISVDKGEMIITVNNVNETLCTAQVADAVAVANAVLSKQQIEQVSQGETIEIRIDVERIDGAVSQKDREIAEQGIKESRSRISDLEIGMYVDISMFVRIGQNDWNAVREAREPIEIIIDVPEELQAYAADFYIVRVHEGAYTLLEDLDDAGETITIQTALFSTYAIAYTMENGTPADGKCSLCHICPTFLGICYFIWLAIIIAAVVIIILLLRRRKQGEEDERGGRPI